MPLRPAAVLLALLLAAGAMVPAATRGGHIYVEDYCEVRDLGTPFQAFDDHDLTVLDWTYALGSGYVPPDLARAANAGFGGASGDKFVRAVLLADLAALRQASLAAGHRLELRSAYRSYDTQAATFDYWVGQVGYQQALQVSARAGHSEHQLGTTIDVTSGGIPPWQYDDWAATPAGAWMAANGWRYGFVMSYPSGSEPVTCYDYEPWHYRWIGRADAAAQRGSGLTVREYLEARIHARFVDIRFTEFEGDATWIADRGITAGCRTDPDRFCPTVLVTRAQMASFLARALDLSGGADVDAFTDDDGSIHEANINRLAHAGLTDGCALDRYCPDEPIERDQMASFLVRAFDLGRAAAPDAFGDDEASIHEANIDRLAEAGVTAGCGSGQFCPNRPVTRGEMAAFLRRALAA